MASKQREKQNSSKLKFRNDKKICVSGENSISFSFQHPFLQGNLTSSIARDLLDRLRNGTTNHHSNDDRDDDEDEKVRIEKKTNFSFSASTNFQTFFFQSNRPAPRKISSNRDEPNVSSSSKEKNWKLFSRKKKRFFFPNFFKTFGRSWRI